MLIGNPRLRIMIFPTSRNVPGVIDRMDLARLNQVPQNTPATRKSRNVLMNCAAFSFIFNTPLARVRNRIAHHDGPRSQRSIFLRQPGLTWRPETAGGWLRGSQRFEWVRAGWQGCRSWRIAVFLFQRAQGRGE